MMGTNDITKQDYFLILIGSIEESTEDGVTFNDPGNLFIGYTKHYNVFTECAKTMPNILKKAFNISGVLLRQYICIDDEEFYNMVKEEFNLSITVNDEIEIYEYENCSSQASYYTSNFLESISVYDDMMYQYMQFFYCDLMLLKKYRKILNFPENVRKMFKLFEEQYLLLMTSLFVIDLDSFSDSEFKKAMSHLIHKKLPNVEKPTMDIFDVVCLSGVTYNYIKGGLSFLGGDVY